jgi:molybdopterin converting factor small subunit
VNVVFHIPMALRRLAGGAADVTVTVDGAAPTVGEALAALYRLHPGLRDRVQTELGEVRPHVQVFVGSESIRYAGGLAAPLTAGEVSILPAVSGGCRARASSS